MDNAVAIVGMSCRFAGCPNPAALWDVVMRRESMLTIPGPDAELPLGQRNVFNCPYPTRIGQLGSLYSCVPSMQNFPRQVNAGENQDLYFATQLAFDALADASVRPRSTENIRGTVRLGYSPPFNSSTVNWLQHTYVLDQTLEVLRRFLPTARDDMMDVLREKLLESLPVPNAASFLLGSGYRFVSWIARECGFGGTATIVDAGMLTGATTLMDAIGDLLSGHADIALAGALTPPLNRAYLEGLSGEVRFSTRCDLQPFSEDSDGTIPGEGGAFFVLKRREDALNDRDRIYALVRSVAVGHGREDDPAHIISTAVDRAGIQVRTIGLIEGDGSGIRSIEEREISAIDRLWGKHSPGGPLVGVGSVKGNVGHCLRASMAAGIVKAVLALHHKVLPPQVVTDRPVAGLCDLASSAYLLDDARPWISGDSASPRRAVVLGANFDSHDAMASMPTGGRSAAVVLEEEPEVRE